MGVAYYTLSPFCKKGQTTPKLFLMEKYLPNQSIVGSPFDAHPSGILSSLSHALLSTQPPAAGLGSCGISLDLRTGRRKGPACKAFLLSTEGQAWMEGQDQLLPCMSVPRSSSSKGSNLLQSPLTSFMPAFSLLSSRMRLWLVLELYQLQVLPGLGEWTGYWRG